MNVRPASRILRCELNSSLKSPNRHVFNQTKPVDHHHQNNATLPPTINCNAVETVFALSLARIVAHRILPLDMHQLQPIQLQMQLPLLPAIYPTNKQVLQLQLQRLQLQ
jgi:hypothetical protein